MRTLIIEDEELARDLVKTYLKNFPEIELIGECEDGFSGVKAVNELSPDLLFLDIQMPKLTGFEVLELIDKKPIVIFTTAYDQYAIKAFEMNAIDYLLKPFSSERFRTAVDKAISIFNSNLKNNETKVNQLVEFVKESQEKLERVAVKTGTKIKVISIEKINYLEAQDDYVMIYTAEGKYLKESTMKYFESHLDPKQFVRIHRSYIVNIQQIHQIELFEKESYIVVLKDGNKLKTSKSGYKNLKEILAL